MKYLVKVKTRQKAQKVESFPDGSVQVSVTEAPEHGRANSAVINALAKHFKVAKNKIRIAVGHKTKSKLIEID